MVTTTPHLRHVRRTTNFGDGPIEFVGLQQWMEFDDSAETTPSGQNGWWQDVPVSPTDDACDPAP